MSRDVIMLRIFGRGAYPGLFPPHGQYIQSKVFLQERSRGDFEMTHRRQGGDSGMIEAENGLMWPQAKGRLQTSGLEESRNSL